jgi:hypothetical protein
MGARRLAGSKRPEPNRRSISFTKRVNDAPSRAPLTRETAASILAGPSGIRGENMQEKDRAKSVEELQEIVAALEMRINDLALKAQIVNSQLVGKIGLDKFFGGREFWDNITDVGTSECHQRCIEDLQAEYAGIDANTSYSAAQRQAARAEALARAQGVS